tara:strand:- start:356 stop:565 length:210 start_codon:yes stop_codon:yes gene_type:complete
LSSPPAHSHFHLCSHIYFLVPLHPGFDNRISIAQLNSFIDVFQVMMLVEHATINFNGGAEAHIAIAEEV